MPPCMKWSDERNITYNLWTPFAIRLKRSFNQIIQFKTICKSMPVSSCVFIINRRRPNIIMLYQFKKLTERSEIIRWFSFGVRGDTLQKIGGTKSLTFVMGVLNHPFQKLGVLSPTPCPLRPWITDASVKADIWNVKSWAFKNQMEIHWDKSNELDFWRLILFCQYYLIQFAVLKKAHRCYNFW